MSSSARFISLLTASTCSALISHATLADTRVYTSPESLEEGSEFILNTVLQHESACGSRYQQELTIQEQEISIRFEEPADLACTEQHIPGLSTTFQQQVGPLPVGNYKVSVYKVNGQLDQKFTLVIDRVSRTFEFVNHESPTTGQTVSGVGLIRGWACDWYSQDHLLQYQIDGGEKHIIPYGSERIDSEDRCSGAGRTQKYNGWGAVVNWNNYSPGTHLLSIWYNGRKVKENEIVIAKHSGAFLKGLSRNTSVTDFPSLGEQTSLSWSEANQNFIIVESK